MNNLSARARSGDLRPLQLFFLAAAVFVVSAVYGALAGRELLYGAYPRLVYVPVYNFFARRFHPRTS